MAENELHYRQSGALKDAIIGHKSCNMLSILNKLTLQNKLQNLSTNNVVLDKKVNTQKQPKKISNIKPLPEPEN